MFCAGFNVTEIRHGGRSLLTSDHRLQGIACHLKGRTLAVEHGGPLARVRVHLPAVDTVTVNGTPVPFRRIGDTTIVLEGASPFLEHLSPADSVVFAGGRRTIRFRVWNPGGSPISGALAIRATDDWDEHVRSQRDWWGGIVNLLPLTRGSHRRAVFPAALRVAADWLERGPGEPVSVAPGSSADIPVTFDVPADIQPAAYPVMLQFGGITTPWRLHVRQPLELDVSLPNGPRTILRLTVLNTAPDSQDVKLSVTPSREWKISGNESRTVRLPGGAQRHVEYLCSFADRSSGNRPFTVSVDAEAGQFRTGITQDLYVAVARPARHTPSLDGSWQGWDCSSPIVIDSVYQQAKLLLGNQPWNGRGDLSAIVHLMYDTEFLYVGADVLDDSLVTRWNFPAMSYPWDTDCMEVVLDTRTGADQKRDPPTPGLFRHLSMAEFRRTEFGPELWRGGGAGGPLLPKTLLVPAAESFWSRTAHGYTLICRYRLAHLRLNSISPGATIGFDLAINDNDGTTYRKNTHIWAGFTKNQSWWDMATIGTLVFGHEQQRLTPTPPRLP
jgi:hypothetical protein